VPIWLASAAKVIGWKGFVSIGLAIALLAAWLLHKHDVGTIENLRNKNAQTEARLTISNQSIAELQSDLAAKNAESLARAAALTASEKQRAADDLRLAQEQKASQTQIDRLNGLALSQRPVGECTVPKELDDALTGL